MKKNQKEEIAHVFEYQVNIAFDPRDEIFVARVPELENCHTHGKTPEEALAHAKEAIELWLETAQKNQMAIPEPVSRKRFSGKFILRASENLHASLAQEALSRGKSMNELALELISYGLNQSSRRSRSR